MSEWTNAVEAAIKLLESDPKSFGFKLQLESLLKLNKEPSREEIEVKFKGNGALLKAKKRCECIESETINLVRDHLNFEGADIVEDGEIPEQLFDRICFTCKVRWIAKSDERSCPTCKSDAFFTTNIGDMGTTIHLSGLELSSDYFTVIDIGNGVPV